jgi:WD40 repeat protein
MSLQPPHRRDDADGLTPWTPGEDPSGIESSPSFPPGRWDDFLARVERVCRLREGAGARIDRVAVGLPFGGFLLVSKLDRGIAEEYPVAALEQPITEELLDAFLRDIDARFRGADPAVRSELVYRGELASEALCRRAKRRGVRLISFEEYRGLIDFRRYLEWQTGRLVRDPIYPPALYVDQRADLHIGREPRRVERAIDTLLEMLDADHGRFVLVLGDFGTGKTFLLHEIARRLVIAEGRRLVPVLIEMRALEKARSLDALVAQHLTLVGMDRIDLPAFRYMLAEGRIVLLFDGFDELALRVSYERAIEHFDTLIEATEGQAKVVVTSRTQHFISDSQVKTVLANRAAELSGYRLMRIRPFEADQIRSFLGNLLGEEEAAEARFRLLDEVKDLLGLSANPRMLSFIAEVPEAELLEAKRREGTITSAGLYQLLIERWLVFEVDRSHPRGAAAGLDVKQRHRAVTELALLLWGRMERTIHVLELPAAIVEAVKTLSTHEHEVEEGIVKHQIGSGTLLVRDEEGNFSFIHQSVLEWLVAEAAAEEVKQAGDAAALGAREMSDLMADFFVALAGPEVARRWAEQGLEAASGVLTSNALRVLRRMGAETPEGLNLAGKDLRGKDLSGRRLRRADLREADLTGALLVRVDLTGAMLEGAMLGRANLAEARLVGADLRGADLSFASLLGADLRRTRLKGARLCAAKLVGAQIDEGALDGCETTGAALASPRDIASMVSSKSGCNSVAWSPDGTRLASGHDDGLIRLWDATTGTMLRALSGHARAVMSVAFGPDGRMLASGSMDRSIRVWDLETSAGCRVLSGHEHTVASVAFGVDGKALASGSYDKTVRLWDVETGALLHVFVGHKGVVRGVAFCPDGKILASGSYDRTVRLWDVEKRVSLRVFVEHENGVTSVAWSPDGKTLASGSLDRMIQLWEVETGSSLRVLSGHENGVMSIAFCPDGKRLASGSEDGRVRLWEVETGAALRVLSGHENAVMSVAWSSDAKTLASASYDHSVRLWEAETWTSLRVLEGHENGVRSVAFCPDGKRLASGSDDRNIRLWEVETATSLGVLKRHQHAVMSVAFSPDGKTLASGSYDRRVRLWEVETGASLRVLRGHENVVRSVAFCPDGKTLATGSGDCSVRVWEVETGASLRVLSGHENAVRSVAWSPDGTILASGSDDCSIQLWEVDMGASLRVLRGHENAVRSVSWSPDGKTLATGSGDRIVRLWEIETGDTLGILSGHARAATSVAFCPDGKTLASGSDDKTVRLWDVRTGRALRVLSGHAASVTSLAFGPEGATLASASTDGTIRLWDVATGTCLVTLLALPEGWVAFSPDGRYRLGGYIAGAFWHAIGLCRFEPGELDPYLPKPLRIPDGEPLFTLPSVRPKPLLTLEVLEERSDPSPSSTVTILFLGANPSDTTRRALDREVREIQERLHASAYRDRIRVFQAWAVGPGDLQACLLRHEPDVVHFSGQGSEAGLLLLEDDLGRAFAVNKASLTGLFQILRREIRCVVLSACFSADQAQAIAAHIDCVVGMNASVPEESAITFAGAFYQALGFGRSVADAFALGRNAVGLKDLPAEDAPVLLSREGVDPGVVHLVAASEGPHHVS